MLNKNAKKTYKKVKNHANVYGKIWTNTFNIIIYVHICNKIDGFLITNKIMTKIPKIPVWSLVVMWLCLGHDKDSDDFWYEYNYTPST